MALYQGVAQPTVINSALDVQSIQPSLATSSQQGTPLNGVFSGYATNMVAFNVLSPGNPYTVYDFASTPMQLGGTQLPQSAGYTSDQINQPPDANGDYPAQWVFNVPLNELQSTNPQSYTWISFQVIAQNTSPGFPSHTVGGLGQASQGSFLQTLPVQISTSATHTLSTDLQQIQQSSTTDPPGGDQALAIQDVRLDVSVPN